MIHLKQVPKSLSNGEGAVITLDGHRKGAYKDDEGKLHIVDTTCTTSAVKLNGIMAIEHGIARATVPDFHLQEK